jgi:signal transduction histidine kinase
MLHAQSNAEKDSLLNLLSKTKEDSVRVDLYYKYGELFEMNLPDTAVFYYKKAKELSERIQFKQGIRLFTSYYIVILNNQGKFREALDLCREAVNQYEKEGNKTNLAAAYINVGSEWQYLSDFEQASVFYLKALKLADELQNKRYQRVCNNNLASVFNSLLQYEKGRSYAVASLSIAKEMKDDYGIASSTINIATSDFYLKKYNESLALYKEVELLGIKMNDNIIRMDGWLGIADNNRELKNYNEAERYYKQILSFSEQNNTPEYEMYAHMGISDMYIKQKRFADAEVYIRKGIILAQQLGTKTELRDLYLRASELYESKQDFRTSLDYQKKFRLLNDTIYSEKNTSTINQLEARYEFEKKETQIKQLETDKQLQQLSIRQKNIFNYVLAGSTIGLLIISLLSYRTYQQKQKLQQKQIAELEKEKQLLAAEAVLQGQEEERTRLAKDLHDGLGGMLSGIKYSFTTMKVNLILTPENALAFERSMNMLDSSIKELRLVAHNLMPENLVKFGLDTALKDFCRDITASGVIKVNYHSFGMEQLNLSQNTEVIIYRIIQELINNTIKHAEAKEAIVQLQLQNKQLQITVEDDGKGFDVNSLAIAKGIGWSNIKNRVEYLKGTVTIVSEKDKGTGITIEVNV